MLLNCGVGEDSWESLGLQGHPTSPFWRRSALGFLWKEWCWSWNSSPLATSCEELTHWKRLWCWEGLRAGGEGDGRGWDGWMASLTRWTWVWVNSGSWWWTGKPGVLQFMGSQRVGHDWVTELNWKYEDYDRKRQLGKSDRGRIHTIYQPSLYGEFGKILDCPGFFFIFFLAMWLAVSSPTRDWTRAPSVKAQNHNY